MDTPNLKIADFDRDRNTDVDSTNTNVEIVISEQQQKTRIDKVFADLLHKQWSRAYIKKAILEGQLFVNDQPVTEVDYRVKCGEKCRLTLMSQTTIELRPSEGLVDVLYEDDDLLVVNKPEGQVVHPGNGVEPGTTLVEKLLWRYPLSAAAGSMRPGVVHRLDQATSGVILFAKTDAAYWGLIKMFTERKIHKTYYALVWGIPIRLSGVINSPIGRSMRDRTAMCITTQGREAVTRWQVLEAFKKANQTLLACYPFTGRTHQLRVHLKSVGHPIVGDPKYGKIKDTRLFLHAYQIEFEHPITHELCLFQSPLPTSFSSRLLHLQEIA